MKSIYCIGAMAIAMTMTSCATTSLPVDTKIPTKVNVTRINGKFTEFKCKMTLGKVFEYKGVKYCVKRAK